MIAGIVGIIVAFLIFVLVLLLTKREPNPKIAVPLNQFLTSQGFVLLDPSDPMIKTIKDDFRAIGFTSFVEQTYKRSSDNCVVCWTTNYDNENRFIALIPQTIQSGAWILFFFPTIKGIGEKIVRKGFEISVGHQFSKINLDIPFDLYIQNGTSMPPFKADFFTLLLQCGNIILRSTGSIVLIERVAITMRETIEQEVRELLKITQLLKEHL